MNPHLHRAVLAQTVILQRYSTHVLLQPKKNSKMEKKEWLTAVCQHVISEIPDATFTPHGQVLAISATGAGIAKVSASEVLGFLEYWLMLDESKGLCMWQILKKGEMTAESAVDAAGEIVVLFKARRGENDT